ncbi:phosphoribosylanthranilate isomerase [Myroides marinus]|uniref:N-(5'-phosphoribosyl)anthranilate isomerase n=1 Tax=Myroides marinus TaxID=703342 RepID=A0A165QL79_9FLAO|nr:phosphoribosylanthranilate isomerase [Myroides marinus]KUF37856.1 phosphoribosylanthranilate isomerase [Myroides marinus]KZE75472.1 phosphoribosylanthranilate isomerase [Myroides marinus]
MKKIKICGMFDPKNIDTISQEDIDLMGFIFYPKSKRYVREDINKAVDNLPHHIKKVGVFVNATREEVIKLITQYHLDYVQLHGDESPEDCAYYKEKGIKVIKAFSIGQVTDLEKVAPYSNYCDLFIFDTPTSDYGGSGLSFDWDVLKHYRQDTPYLLSGGLGLHNIESALLLRDDRLIGFDLNSKLENDQHHKDITLVRELVKNIREYERI